MARHITLNSDKLIKINNMPQKPNNEILYNDGFKKVGKIIKVFLTTKPYKIFGNDVYLQINYFYEKFPPKTSRINFRGYEQIKKIEDIPIISSIIEKVTISNEKKFKTKLVYKITLSELKKFEDDLKLIMSKEYFINIDKFELAGNEYKELIKNLSLIYNFDFNFLYENFEEKLQIARLINLDNNMLSEFKKSINNFEGLYDKAFNEVVLENENISEFIKKYGFSIVYLNSKNINVGDEINYSSDYNNEFEKFIFKNNLPIPEFNTPIIGVIDSGFNVPEIFKPYVVGGKAIKLVDCDEEYRDFIHGTEVSSILIANDTVNDYKDGLGNFKVKHYEIFKRSDDGKDIQIDLVSLRDNLIKIVEENKEKIKIWNLSFSSKRDKFLNIGTSSFGNFLDKVAKQYNVLFIVSAGNDAEGKSGEDLVKTLGSPADAYNAISVGSVKKINNKVVTRDDYSALGFSGFVLKPDVAISGGPKSITNHDFKSYNGTNKCVVSGTSFSTPLISRRAAYLQKLGYNINEIRAKIINDTIRLSQTKKASAFGYLDYKNINNIVDFKLSGKLNDNKPSILKLNLESVRKLSISYSFFSNPIEIISSEYCINHIDFKLYKKITKNPIDEEKFYEQCKIVKEVESKKDSYKYNNSEPGSRSKKGKFSTMWKKEYKITEGGEFYIWIKLLNLHTNFLENYYLDFSLSINFEEYDNEDKLIKINEEIIDQHAEIIVNESNIDN